MNVPVPVEAMDCLEDFKKAFVAISVAVRCAADPDHTCREAICSLLNDLQCHRMTYVIEEFERLRRNNWIPTHEQLVDIWYTRAGKSNTKRVLEDIFGTLRSKQRSSNNRQAALHRTPV